MRRFFARNLLFVVGINLLIKPVWVFGIDRAVQNRVGHGSYGGYSALLNLSIIFQILLDFGLNSYASRQVSADPSQLPKLFPALAGARLLLSGLYIGIVTGIALAMGFRGAELLLLGGTLLIQTFSLLLLFVRANIAALQRFKLDGLLSVTDRGLMIVVCGLLLYAPPLQRWLSIGTFVWAQILCYAVALLFGLYLLKRIARISVLPVFRPAQLAPVIRQGAPYALLTFLMAIYMRADILLLERLVSDAEAGIYAQAARLLDVFNMIALMVAGVQLPLFGRMISEGQSPAPIVRLSAGLLIPAGIVASAAMWAFGPQIMQRLYPGAGPYNAQVAAWLLTALPAYSLMYVYNTLLTAAGRIRILNGMAALGAVLSLVLNVIFIPRYGALGAAVVAAGTLSLLGVLSLFAVRRSLSLAVSPRWLLLMGVFAVLVSGAAYALQRWDGVDWMWRLGMLGGVGGGLCVALQLYAAGPVRGWRPKSVAIHNPKSKIRDPK